MNPLSSALSLVPLLRLEKLLNVLSRALLPLLMVLSRGDTVVDDRVSSGRVGKW